MGDERLPSADYYRRIAEEIIQLADKAQLPEVCDDLLEIAERFRRMAAFVERRYPDRCDTPFAPADPEDR